MKKIVFLLFCFYQTAFGQLGQVDHWETIFSTNDVWEYKQYEENDSVPNNWFYKDFKEVWTKGNLPLSSKADTGSLIIANQHSVFLRKTFVIKDTSQIRNFLFSSYYRDGINIFINGYKVYLEGISKQKFIADPRDTAFYVLPYYKNPKELIPLENELHHALRNDTNVIAIQLHVHDTVNSHLFLNFSLHAGMRTSSTQFFAVNDTFIPPPIFDLNTSLPIMRINTFDREIVQDSSYEIALFVNYDSNTTTYEYLDTGNHYIGRARLKIRGQSSAEFPKKSYTIITKDKKGVNKDVSLLGFPSEHHWVLNSPYSDKSYLRNVLVYKIWEKMGHYAPRTKFVDLFMNRYYNGVYVFMEKIKRDKNRVDINKLSKQEISGNDLTGGYLMKIDKQPIRGYDAWKSYPDLIDSFNYIDNIIHFVYPDEDDINYEQKNYIISYMKEFEEILLENHFESSSYGFKKYIDMASWVDYLLLTELSKDVDSYKYSMYFYKKKASNGGQLFMGPAWDYNYGLGNINLNNSENCALTSDWIYNKTFRRVFWFERMMEDSIFNQSVKCRWASLRKTFLSNDSINTYLDAQVSHIEDEVKKSLYKWDQLDRFIYPNPYVWSTYEQEIEYLRSWTIERFEWMDSELSSDKCIDLIESGSERIICYPNPTIDNMTAQILIEDNGYYQIGIYNVQNILVQSIESNYLESGNQVYQLQFNDLAKGVYWISVEKNNKLYASRGFEVL